MPEEQFVISDHPPARVVALTLPVVIDAGEFDRLNESLLAALSSEPGGRWVLDLTDVAYMGSSVLGLMVNLRQVIKEGEGKLVLCGMSERLTQIFRMCCMERLFTITKVRGEALRLLGAR